MSNKLLLLVILGIAAAVSLATTNVNASSQAIVKVESNTGWSGSIMDSGFDSATQQGQGNANVPIECNSGIFVAGIYSLFIQKQGEGGTLTISVVQDGTVLDTASTSAAYSVVTLAGNCK
jgi:hypothetical protein